MDKLRKQIKESFFNPIYHFFPLIVFLIVDNVAGRNWAWSIAIPLFLIFTICLFIAYNQLFVWYFFSAFIFLAVSLSAFFTFLSEKWLFLSPIIDDLVCWLFLGLSLLFRSFIEKKINARTPKFLPMKNNFEEYFNFIQSLFLIIAGYLLFYFIIYQFPTIKENFYLELLQVIYIGAIVFLLAFEFCRVQIVRHKLLKEEWWPIVNEQGKIVGNVQPLVSLKIEKKYMHPIIRILFLKENMIFLQKNCENDLIFPCLWDAAISNHIRTGETIEDCIERTAEEKYGLKDLKPFFLSNYIHRTENEQHYAFLFIVCNVNNIEPNYQKINQTKWWTLQQIEENLSAGIFTQNFIIEYNLLQRSGVFENKICNCECKLKELFS